MCHEPGVQVVAAVPVAGPVPPPISVVMPALRASSKSCGQMKWTCASIAPAVRMRPSPAMASVPGPTTMSTSGWMSGLPALPMPAIRPSRKPKSALMMPQWSRISALVITVVDRTGEPGRLALPHAIADHLAAAELDLLAVERAVGLDLEEELGVGEAHPVAGRRPVHLGVGGTAQAIRHRGLPVVSRARP